MKNKKNNIPEEQVLNKFLAHAGVDSRRKTAELIKQGFVKVNGKKVTDPSYKVKPTDVILLDNKPVTVEEKKYILLNKPTKIIATASDDLGRTTVLDIVDSKGARLYPVGRLDYETTGLILLTNDGELANKLAHPRFEVKKVYHVTLDKTVFANQMQLIKKGVKLEDGVVKVDAITHIASRPPNHVHITLHSGKYRVVRRLFEQLGFVIHNLDRIQYAGLTKRALPVGAWRNLRADEVKKLYALTTKTTKKK